MTDTTEQTERRPRIAEIIASGTGIPMERFRGHAKLARWTADQARDELERDGWEQRFREAVQAGIDAEAAERARKELGELLDGTGPAAMVGIELSLRYELVGKKLRATAERCEPDSDGSRVLCGPTATGKSMTAVCVLERMLRRQIAEGIRSRLDSPDADYWPGLTLTAHVPVMWVRAADLPVARLQTSLGAGEATTVRDAMRAELLVLDDLGWESRRAGADDVIGEVVSARYDAGKPTLTTTGLRPEQVVERYGEAFMRRLTECSGHMGVVVDLWPAEARH